jgi:hypothetical protein
MRLHVILQRNLGQGECFIALSQAILYQSFHGLSVSMVWIFPQDLLRILQAYTTTRLARNTDFIQWR